MCGFACSGLLELWNPLLGKKVGSTRAGPVHTQCLPKGMINLGNSRVVTATGVLPLHSLSGCRSLVVSQCLLQPIYAANPLYCSLSSAVPLFHSAGRNLLQFSNIDCLLCVLLCCQVQSVQPDQSASVLHYDILTLARLDCIMQLFSHTCLAHSHYLWCRCWRSSVVARGCFTACCVS